MVAPSVVDWLTQLLYRIPGGFYFRMGIRWLAEHSGVPAAVLGGAAALLIYKSAKKVLRVLVFVCLVGIGIAFASQQGWLTW
jgi:hypothetical protein